jgi:hypothetical protein
MISEEAIQAAIIRLFAEHARASAEPLEANALYELWRTTGLRRDDLAAGIIALLDSGVLRAEHGSGVRLFSLAQSAGGDPSAAAASAVKAELALAAQRSEETSRRRFGRRSRDQESLHA